MRRYRSSVFCLSLLGCLGAQATGIGAPAQTGYAEIDDARLVGLAGPLASPRAAAAYAPGSALGTYRGPGSPMSGRFGRPTVYSSANAGADISGRVARESATTVAPVRTDSAWPIPPLSADLHRSARSSRIQHSGSGRPASRSDSGSKLASSR